jgi:hypothetical protein
MSNRRDVRGIDSYRRDDERVADPGLCTTEPELNRVHRAAEDSSGFSVCEVIPKHELKHLPISWSQPGNRRGDAIV